MQFSCAEICIGHECVNMMVELLEVHHWTYFWFILLYEGHRRMSPLGSPGFFFQVWHELAVAHPHAKLLLIVLPDLHHYLILRYPIVQSLRCVVLWPLPYHSPGSALMVKGGSEVGFINRNGCTFSDSSVADLYLSQTANSNSSQCINGISPQQQVKSQWFAPHHQHTDLGRTTLLCGYGYHSNTATWTGHASNRHDVHCCSPLRPMESSFWLAKIPLTKN